MSDRHSSAESGIGIPNGDRGHCPKAEFAKATLPNSEALARGPKRKDIGR